MNQQSFQKHSSQQETGGTKAVMAADIHNTMGTDPGAVAVLAYTLYEQRGREDGYALDDWLEAEQRIVRGGEDRGF